MSVRLTGPPLPLTFHPALRTRLIEYAEQLLERTGHVDSELSIFLADDATIIDLNRSHRGSQNLTDVLSFSLIEGTYAKHRGIMLGDIVIGLDVARSQARVRSVSLLDELTRLLIHGLLHLLGHDHQRPDETRRMQCEEVRLHRELKS